MRTLEQLIDKQDPCWPMMQDWIKNAKNKVGVLPKSQPAADQALLETQVTTRSPMGAIIHETGGLLIDDGWIRILGSGSAKLKRTLPGWNKDVDNAVGANLPYLLVADDAVGGFFAVNGNTPAAAPGHVLYFAPDSLNREDTKLTYTEFINFCLDGDIKTFYEDKRWSGWEKDVKSLDGDMGYSFYPFLWAAGESIEKRSRKAVPIKELYQFFLHSEKNVDRTKPMQVKITP